MLTDNNKPINLLLMSNLNKKKKPIGLYRINKLGKDGIENMVHDILFY